MLHFRFSSFVDMHGSRSPPNNPTFFHPSSDPLCAASARTQLLGHPFLLACADNPADWSAALLLGGTLALPLAARSLGDPCAWDKVIQENRETLKGSYLMLSLKKPKQTGDLSLSSVPPCCFQGSRGRLLGVRCFLCG